MSKPAQSHNELLAVRLALSHGASMEDEFEGIQVADIPGSLKKSVGGGNVGVGEKLVEEVDTSVLGASVCRGVVGGKGGGNTRDAAARQVAHCGESCGVRDVNVFGFACEGFHAATSTSSTRVLTLSACVVDHCCICVRWIFQLRLTFVLYMVYINASQEYDSCERGKVVTRLRNVMVSLRTPQQQAKGQRGCLDGTAHSGHCATKWLYWSFINVTKHT